MPAQMREIPLSLKFAVYASRLSLLEWVKYGKAQKKESIIKSEPEF